MKNSKLNIDVLDPDHWDESMRYESLACCAFNCERGGGPDGIAEAGYYDTNISIKTNVNGLKALELIVDALIEKTSGSLKSDLQVVRSSLSGKLSYESAADLVD